MKTKTGEGSERLPILITTTVTMKIALEGSTTEEAIKEEAEEAEEEEEDIGAR
jgi:hypothetical protein